MNLQKCLSLREIIQRLNSAINNTDHDTQTHFRIWNDFRIIFIFFLYRGRTPAFIFDTEKRTQVRVSQWEGHRSVKWRHTTHRRQTSVINQFKLITVLLKIKGTTLYLSVPIFKRERIKIQLSEFNFYSVNSKNIIIIYFELSLLLNNFYCKYVQFVYCNLFTLKVNDIIFFINFQI